MVKFAFWKTKSTVNEIQDIHIQPNSPTAKDDHHVESDSSERGRKAAKKSSKSRARSVSPSRAKSEKGFLSSLFGLKSHTHTHTDAKTHGNTAQNAKTNSVIPTHAHTNTSVRTHISQAHTQTHAHDRHNGYGDGYDDRNKSRVSFTDQELIPHNGDHDGENESINEDNGYSDDDGQRNAHGLRAQAVRALQSDGDEDQHEEQKEDICHHQVCTIYHTLYTIYHIPYTIHHTP
ncbi:hypothetical protein EON63_21500 [archaeon]|nr:MAG: hypothetical protein EON63_21500 [archaeon]